MPFYGRQEKEPDLQSHPESHLTLSLPRVINSKFPLQPHQKYYITQCEELDFSQRTNMKDDYTTNSHYLINFYWKGWENVLFELGGERVKRVTQHSSLLLPTVGKIR